MVKDLGMQLLVNGANKFDESGVSNLLYMFSNIVCENAEVTVVDEVICCISVL